MTEDRNATEARRRFLKLVGGSAVIAPLAGITGCSGEQEAPAQGPAAAGPEAAAEAAAEEMAPAQDGGMPEISEDDPTAKSLGYRHEAANIDGSQYPRYQPGQLCSNCALFQGGDGDEWAGCSIFPGQLVKASGWCSVYAPTVG